MTDADLARVDFIRLNVSRGLVLAKSGKARQDHGSELNKREAARILREFRRYLDWCKESLPTGSRQQIESELFELDLAVLTQSEVPAM
jgi:hypothetical protein